MLYALILICSITTAVDGNCVKETSAFVSQSPPMFQTKDDCTNIAQQFVQANIPALNLSKGQYQVEISCLEEEKKEQEGKQYPPEHPPGRNH